MAEWYGISSSNVYSYCGYTSGDYCEGYLPWSPGSALDGRACWVHHYNHKHWLILDLGNIYSVEWLRGASNRGWGNPWYVDVFVSDGDSFDWILVASDINTWRLGCLWQEVNCSDVYGRYILIEITECQWESGYPNRDWLQWGTPNCSGSPPPDHHLHIFDVYVSSPRPRYFSGYVSCSSSFISDAELNGIAKHLSGTNECMLTSWSELHGIAKYLSGTNECMLAAWSLLRDQFCNLKGEVTIQSTITGSLDVTISAYGSALSTTSASGVLEFVPFTELVAGLVLSITSALGTLTDASKRLAGTIDIQSIAEGKLSVPEHLAGTINIQSSVTGNITGFITRLAGSITSTVNVRGKLSSVKPISGIVIVQSTVSGEITVEYTGPPPVYPVYLAGTMDCYSTVGGKLAGMTRELVAVVAANSSTSGVMATTRKLTSTCSCTASCTGSLTTRTLVAGTITSICSTTGTLKVTRRLISVIAPLCTVSGELSLLNVVFLVGEISSTGSITGSLKIVKELTSTISSVSTLSGLMATTRKFTGTMAMQSTASGSMERGRGLAGTVEIVSTLTSVYLSLEKTIVGTISSTCIITGNLIKAGEFRVTVTVQSTVGGLLKVGRRFSGTITVTSTVSGILRSRVPHFVIADALVSPILVCTIHVSSSLESTGSNQPVLAHAVRASPVFTFAVDSLPIFAHSTRINEELKLLTV